MSEQRPASSSDRPASSGRPASSDGPARPPRPQVVLEVLERERLSPHLVRLWLGGAGFADFTPNGHADAYVKLVFVRPELGLEPPYDLAALREAADPADRPVTRTYTVRRVDAERIAIDVVVHGDDGLAGPWAASAEIGSRIAMHGPGGGYSPDADADWHLLAGDESALPAIASALEAMPAGAVGDALIEVDGAEDELPLTAPPGVTVRWLHRDGAPAGTSSVLADAVRALPWRNGVVSVFAHGERESMKVLRDVILGQRGVPRAQVSLSGYWAHGRAEDRFQAEKREPIGQILPR